MIGGLMFFLVQPVILFLKHGFLNEMDFWIGTLGLVVFAIIEVVLFFWVFGPKKAWKELTQGADIRLPKFFFPIMKYVTPLYLMVLLAFWFFQDGINVLLMKGVPAENYAYIWFARFLLATVLIVILVLVRIAWQKKHVIEQRVPS